MSFNLPAPENTLDRDNQEGPGRVLQLAFGFRAAKALMSAVELDLFTVLSEGPLESGDLIDRLEEAITAHCVDGHGRSLAR